MLCIETPEENSIIFRFEPDEQPSTWCEKLLHDDIVDKKEWVVDLNFDDFTYAWFDNFVPKITAKDIQLGFLPSTSIQIHHH